MKRYWRGRRIAAEQIESTARAVVSVHAAGSPIMPCEIRKSFPEALSVSRSVIWLTM
jgi:hypothetical protein